MVTSRSRFPQAEAAKRRRPASKRTSSGWVGPRVRYPLVLAAVDGIVAVVPRGQGDRTDATLYVGQSCLHPRVAYAELGKKKKPTVRAANWPPRLVLLSVSWLTSPECPTAMCRPERRKPRVGELDQVHRAGCVDERELEIAVAVAPARRGPDGRDVRLAEVPTDDDEITAGWSRWILQLP